MTEAQYAVACDYAARVYSQQLKPAEAIKVLRNQHRINPNSARDFIDDYRHLCRGEVFQRAMSGDAMRHFISHVASTQGDPGLRNAVQSLERHIKYYESAGKRTLVMRKVASEFRARLEPVVEFPSRAAARSAMRALTVDDVRAAFPMIDSGAGQQFGAARDYFVRFRGKNYPAKRVIGVALQLSRGRRPSPKDFESGVKSLCFLVLRTLGFPPVDAAGKAVHGGEPASDEAVAGADADVAGAISPLKKTGQGLGLTQAQRRAVELAAMELARAKLEELGFKDIRDVSPTHSCDFLAEREGAQWVIEVKGTTGASPDQILLTANELDLHREWEGHSCLIVAYGIALDRKQNVAAGGQVAVSMPWSLDDWLFLPTAYRAMRIPASSK